MKGTAALDRVRQALREAGSTSADGEEWRCPTHDDDSASLTIKLGDEPGKVVMRCGAGCQTKSVLSRIGLKWADLFDSGTKVVDKVVGRTKYVYEDELPLWDKVKAIATKIYGASEVTADAKVRGQIRKLQEDGYGHYPVCVAKTQYSFSTDPQLRAAPSGHVINVREVRLAAGAEFVVMVCGDIMTMPGLPKIPSAEKIDLTEDGKIIGLF